MLIVVDPAIVAAREAFAAFGDVQTLPPGGVAEADLSRADALIVRSVDRIDARVLSRAPRLRFVGSATAGVDHVDHEALASAGVALASAPGCNARAVVEWVIAALAWAVPSFVRVEAAAPPLTIGVVGCGAVGARMAALAGALGHRVRRCDPPRARRGDPGPWDTLSELVEASDVVTLHVPLTRGGPDRTAGLVDASLAERCLRRGKALVNTSRGAVLDLPAAAAMSEWPGPLILDVWPDEPRVDPALVAAATIASPHVAGYTQRAKVRATAMIVGALAAHLDRPAPSVNVELQTRVLGDLGGGIGDALARLGGLPRDDRRMRALREPGAFTAWRAGYALRAEWVDVEVDERDVRARRWLVNAGFRRFSGEVSADPG